MIYMPNDETFNKCYIVQSSDIIRGYDRVPTNNTEYNYRDYYINSSYIHRDGSGSWGSYSNLPICLDSSLITNNVWYRLDIDKIVVVFSFIFIFCFYFISKLFKRLLNGRRFRI